MAYSAYKHDYRNTKKLERLRELAGAELDFRINFTRDRVRGPHSEIAWYAFLQLLRTNGYIALENVGKGTFHIQIVKELPRELSSTRIATRRAARLQQSAAPVARDVIAVLREAVTAARAAGYEVECSYVRIVEEDL